MTDKKKLSMEEKVEFLRSIKSNLTGQTDNMRTQMARMDADTKCLREIIKDVKKYEPVIVGLRKQVKELQEQLKKKDV